MTVNELTDMERFIVSRWAYSLGEELISNAEYDILVKAMQQQYPDNPYCNRSWSSDPCPTELLTRIGRRDLILRVILSDKTESIPSLNTEIEVKEALQDCNERATLSMKHDGWNIQANYFNSYLVNVHTRGRAADAMDVSFIKEKIPQQIPAKGRVRVVMELTISPTNYRLYFDSNASCRSAVSTALANPSLRQYLDTAGLNIQGVPLNGKCKFEVLREWGFKVPEYRMVEDYYGVLAALEELSKMKTTYAFPTDGVVYDGTITRAIRLAAWEEPIYQSYITGYIESFGPYQISPSLEIYPIKREGSTQRQINITNWQRIIDYNLQPGSPVAFRIASDATADVDLVTTNILQKQFQGEWETYAIRVQENERLKECLGKTYTELA